MKKLHNSNKIKAISNCLFDNSDGKVGSLLWLQRTKKPLAINSNEKVSIVDLFCGCGGFSLGVVEAAVARNLSPEIKLAIDSDSEALKVYAKNFKDYGTNFIEDDISNQFPGKLGAAMHHVEKRHSKNLGNIDFLIAGPPCQGHSDLNNRTRRNDPRNKLYLKVVRAIEVLNPKIAIIENVASVKHDKSEVVRKSIEKLKALNYSIEEMNINALEYSVAQNRKRHLLIAHKVKLPFTINAFIEGLDWEPLALKDVIKDIIEKPEQSSEMFEKPSKTNAENIDRISYLFKNKLFNLPNDKRPPCHQANQHSYLSMYGRLKWNLPSQTITTGFGSIGQGRYIHPSKKRVITPHEAARIQGFPDYFNFSIVKKRITLQTIIGNAVPPPIGAVFSSFLMDFIGKEHHV